MFKIIIVFATIYFAFVTKAYPLYQNSSHFIEYPLKFQNDFFSIQGLTLGTPGQQLTEVWIDTGSSDFVLSKNAYNATESTSFVTSGQQFHMGYGSIADFMMVKSCDTIGFQNTQLQNFTFGLGSLDNLNGGNAILGIGYDVRTAMGVYPNFPTKLKESGVIERRVFAFDGGSQSPSVLFGAVDQNRFKGPLYKNTILKDVQTTGTRATYTSLAITVHSISVKDQIVSNQKLAYEIDSGANVLATTMPVIDNILTVLGVPDFWSAEQYPYYKVDRLDYEISVDLSGYTVEFPISDISGDNLIVNGTTYATLYLAPIQIGSNYTYFGTLPNGILKNYYTVYDLDNGEVFLAPLNQDRSQKSSIIPVTETSYPVSTTTGSKFGEPYTKLYTESLETTVTVEGSSTTSTNSSFVSSATSSIASITSKSTLSSLPGNCYVSR